MNMAERESAQMREMLAAQGVELDDPREPIAGRDAKPANVPLDRDSVRAILVSAGAPAGDLEWLVASCPSLEDARAYRPPPRMAWCPRCDAAALVDGLGCVSCRTAIGGAP